MRYRVIAGYVTVEMGVPGVSGARARRDVRQGLLLPVDVPDAEVRALLEQGHIEPVDDEPASPDPDEDQGDAVPTGTIAEILAWVDSDPDRAALALEAEQAKGDKARSTLVVDLEQLVDSTPE